ncbi:androglobin [Polymixia lowei]
MSRAPPKRKESSSSRVTSSQGQTPNKEAVSLVASASDGLGEQRRCRYPIWPEWNEAEVNGEKWDAAKGAKDGKMGKSPFAPFFEDPEGRICMPPSLKVHCWKRPSEFIVNKGPAVIESETTFDLISPNDHLICSELMRWVISEIYIVWKLRGGQAGEQDEWKPWEHIYSLCKVAKGHVPLYNVYGKYVVRLYWMGCWRKVTVDDSMPFDEANNLLLPASANQSELWPMLLAKALIKVANTDVVAEHRKEMGEFTFIHALTGWIPETVPIQSKYMGKVWEFLKDTIPKFTYPKESLLEEKTEAAEPASGRDSHLNDSKSASPTAAKSPEKSKGAKKPPAPEMVVCASFHPLQLLDRRTSVLREMSDSSEHLRRYGLSRLHSHIVLLTRTRACPLEEPPKPPPVPRWKLIRPRKETLVTDEPREPPVLKPEQFIEVSSPFLSHRINSSIHHNPQLEAKQSSPRKFSCNSTLASFAEKEESDGQQTPEPGTAQCFPQVENLLVVVGGVACDGAACDSVVCDGAACDGVVCDGAACDRVVCDGAACDGVVCDGAACDSVVCDGAAYDGVVCDGAVCDGVVCDGAACDRVVCDGAACDRVVCDGAACDSVVCDGAACDRVVCDGAACDRVVCDGAECDRVVCDGRTGEERPPVTLSHISSPAELGGVRRKSAAAARNHQRLEAYPWHCWPLYHQLTVIAEDREKDDNAASIEQNAADTPGVPLPDRPRTVTAEPEPAPLQPNAPELAAPDKPALQETWVDLDDFAKCFRCYLECHFTSCPDERGSHYLYVDSLQPSQILVSFSVLLHWREMPEETARPGVLLVQPYSWKSLESQLPVLHIQTTCSKAALLSLTPGRHVMCIRTKAALGYHVQLCSAAPFVFGDEETVMPYLTKESMRFSEQASSITMALARVVASFSDEQEQPAARRALEEAHCPQNINTAQGRWEHHRVFNMAVHHMLSRALDRTLTAEERFALRALTADPSLFSSETREHSALLEAASRPLQRWEDRQPTEEEIRAVIILQAGFKGHLAREVLNASKPGTKENLSVSKTLLEMWPSVESDAEKHAASLLRFILSRSGRTAELYPCQQDEWTRVTFADYSVPLQDTANSWVLVFREVFLVPEETLLVAKVYSPVPSCVLHIVDNDTGEELRRVFNRVAPHVCVPNKLGYTFVAEAYTPEKPLAGAKWRMRLIGSREPLPKLALETPLSNFSVKEFRDYYIPKDKNIICRYSVKVSMDHLGTVQFQTSKPDVLIRLSILDHGKEVAGNTGKGHVVIPVFRFQSSKTPSCGAPTAEEKQNREGSSTRDEGVKPAGASQGGGGREGTAWRADSWTEQKQPPAETTGHKYMVQAEVLYKSWALDESQLAFIHTLRALEKNEMKGGNKPEEPIHSTNAETPSSDSHKSATPKPNRKGKGDKEKEKEKPSASSKPGSRQETSLDLTKPNWTLRVVSAQSEAESFEVKKDTERMDKIKAMKQAWETAEPGRSARSDEHTHLINMGHTLKLSKMIAEPALQSRLKFLNQVQHGLASTGGGDTPTDDTESREPAASSLPPDNSVSPSNQESTVIQCEPSHQHVPMDYTPFIRRLRDIPVLKDSRIEDAQRRERSEQIQGFRLLRDTVLEHRKQEVLDRRELKRRQLETYDGLQVALRQRRKEVLAARETFRSRLTAAVTKKQEEERALEVARQADPEKTPATVAAPQQPAKPTKSAGKRKFVNLSRKPKGSAGVLGLNRALSNDQG